MSPNTAELAGPEVNDDAAADTPYGATTPMR